ncbi:MAG TPA: hypothetical protein VFH15_02465 [Pyrinomonadaceae bacterium]|nr:hypothetical protein [Pyrinomonadaceae bacterium]
MSKRSKRLIWMIPAAIAGMVIFIALGGTVVMLLWNWLAPALFGLQLITFWQAIGLLALCRILFGGFGGGSHRSHSGRRIKDRMRERMAERWEDLTPEQREKLDRVLGDRGAQTTPLDLNQSG